MTWPVRAKKVVRAITQRPLRATDVLYHKMHVYNNEAKAILKILIDRTKTVNTASPVLRELYLLMRKADDIAIDCAHKLAPYQSPKLESIEVKNRVEHRFVLRAPKPIASVDEWTKQTGAERARVEEAMAKTKDIAPVAPSLHDYDEDYEDEIKTHKMLN
jgi:hypothetical protein